jgi:hypothetical protein
MPPIDPGQLDYENSRRRPASVLGLIGCALFLAAIFVMMLIPRRPYEYLSLHPDIFPVQTDPATGIMWERIGHATSGMCALAGVVCGSVGVFRKGTRPTFAKIAIMMNLIWLLIVLVSFLG